jgi:hypothetical protein
LTGKDYVNSGKWVYMICWNLDVFRGSATNSKYRSTLIHENCHVWQGQHGTHPTFYMAQSVFSQLYEGIRDIVNVGEWRGWGTHRSTAYSFARSDIGKNWSEFNVEQQCNIIESWYRDENNRQFYLNYDGDYGSGVYGGGSSPYDPRYPYVQDVILAGNQIAVYKAITLPNGADLEIKKIQDILIQLNYLEARYADGLISRGNSPTVRAIRAFQVNNRLAVDGDLGGQNSNTRAKLRLPLSHLTGGAVIK